MAFVSTDETVGSRKAVLANDGSGNKSSYTRVFQVIYNTTVTDLKTVQTAPGIPSMADPYPSDASTQVAKIDPQEVDGHFQFLVMVEYRIPPIGGFVENPTAQPWKLATDIQEFEYFPDIDLDTGDEIRNSAKEYFDPPIQETAYYHVLNLTKNLSAWDLATEFARENTINDDAVTIGGFVFPARCLLCTRYTTSGSTQQNGVAYYPLGAQFIYRPIFTVKNEGVVTLVPGYLRAVIDRGFNYLSTAPAGLHAILDKSGKEAITTPRLLDGLGNAKDPDSDYTPFYFQFRTKKEDDMSAWGLPTVMP